MLEFSKNKLGARAPRLHLLRMDLRFFDPFAEIRKTANHLPHWQQPGARRHAPSDLTLARPNSEIESAKFRGGVASRETLRTSEDVGCEMSAS